MMSFRALSLAVLAATAALQATPGLAQDPARSGVREAPASETFMQAAPSRPPSEPRAAEPHAADLDRARAAARAADPDPAGLERARAAARAAPAAPRGGVACLSARDARGAIRSNKAVPLAHAARAARAAWDGEVIDYRLCSYDGALAYELTLLNADGKVVRARVDAASGKFTGVR